MNSHERTAGPSLFTRARAILAGALVLGVGAAVTVAAWTDNEYSEGSFSATTFTTESSVNFGGTWADNIASPGATMTFSTAGMSPNTFRYGSLWVRTKPASDSGSLTLTAPTIVDTPATAPTLSSVLLYRVITTAAITACDASLFTAGASYIVGSSAGPVALTTAGGSTAVAAAASATLPGTPTRFCFEVTLPASAPNTVQGKATSAVWRVNATSSS